MDGAAGLVDLLMATARAHHEAFIATDGVDPEWPSWYARYLQPRLGSLGDHRTESELTAALVNADRSHRADAPDRPWAEHYADCLSDV